MARGLLRTWALLGVTAALLAVAGCESGPPDDDEQTPTPGVTESPSEDEIAAATIEYIEGEGAILVRLHREAAEMPDALDDAALADRCARFRGMFQDQYPVEEFLEKLQRLPDPQAGRLWTAEIEAMLSTIESCAVGDRREARRRAKLTATAANDLEQRLAELREVGAR
ncbi:hypothetical protein [Streptomyces phytophilus]|uniref:hypothetical protein n=1 Tax=Streptomyces phytophilus TaxID=722715 RepID=UPI0015F048BC|nr:hypothetical protein [Streptomyces phytophilus]